MSEDDQKKLADQIQKPYSTISEIDVILATKRAKSPRFDPELDVRRHDLASRPANCVVEPAGLDGALRGMSASSWTATALSAQRGLLQERGASPRRQAVRRTVQAAIDRGIDYLTLFSFSSENWSWPAEEVEFLRPLAPVHPARSRRPAPPGRQGRGHRRASGCRAILALIEEAERLPRWKRPTQLVVAFNYGSRNEIARAPSDCHGSAAGALDAAMSTRPWLPGISTPWRSPIRI
jgi:hypothetical protein